MTLTRPKYPDDLSGIGVVSEKFFYDFAVNGGAQGAISLGSVPDNVVAVECFYEMVEAFTSGGLATVALGIETDAADGFVTATAFDNAAFGVGFHATTVDGSVANFATKTTDERNIIMTIATADLTAGKMLVWVRYILSE